MKNCLLLTAIVLLFALGANAKKVPGYYINLDYDTVQVIFSISTGFSHKDPYIDLSSAGRAIYFDADDKMQFLSPDEAHEISVTYNNRRARMITRLLPRKDPVASRYNNGYVFMHVLVDGPVKLLSYMAHDRVGVTATGTVTATAHRQLVLQYDVNPFFYVYGLSFRYDMAEYFKDYPELVAKIEKRVYKKKDLPLLVQEYNAYWTRTNRPASSTKELNGF